MAASNAQCPAKAQLNESRRSSHRVDENNVKGTVTRISGGDEWGDSEEWRQAAKVEGGM